MFFKRAVAILKNGNFFLRRKILQSNLRMSSETTLQQTKKKCPEKKIAETEF